MAGWPVRAARSQSRKSPRKIGYLHPYQIEGDVLVPNLRRRWLELGYVEGETILLRTARGDVSRLPDLVTELVGLGVGVLVVVGLPATLAALSTAPGMPVVAIDLETDPLRAGFIESWAKPGRNLTGLFLDQTSLINKLIGLLREAMPGLGRLALVWDPSTRPDQLDTARLAAAAAGFATQILELTKPEDFSAAFETLERGTGVLLLASPALTAKPSLFSTAALQLKLPSISIWRQTAKAGGLIAYGPVLEPYFPRAITVADRILSGTKPGEIPIERPDRYERVIILKTAEQLRVELPLSLVAAADEIIE